jgi:hypothetical protein
MWRLQEHGNEEASGVCRQIVVASWFFDQLRALLFFDEVKKHLSNRLSGYLPNLLNVKFWDKPLFNGFELTSFVLLTH